MTRMRGPKDIRWYDFLKAYRLWPPGDIAWAWLLLPLTGLTCLLILIEVVIPGLWPAP